MFQRNSVRAALLISVVLGAVALEPTIKPSLKSSLKPSSKPTDPPAPSLSPTQTLSPTLIPSGQPSFTEESTITGDYNWKLKGDCCNKQEEATEVDVQIIKDIIERKATFYSKKESGNCCAIEVDVGNEIVQTVIESPPMIYFNLKVTFKSRSIDVNGGVKNLAKDDNYARGFYQWFNNSTQQDEAIKEINEIRYPNLQGHFRAATGSPFDLVQSVIDPPATTTSAPTPNNTSSTSPTINSGIVHIICGMGLLFLTLP